MAEPRPLVVRGLTVHYGEVEALRAVDLEVDRGRLVGIVGPNGAGKSTLIKAVVGAVRPVAGAIEVFGRRGRSALARLTYVHQRGEVDWDFPVTVRDVASQGLYPELGLLRRPSRAQKERVARALEQVALTDLADRQIAELSGGQQQRTFLARALVHAADLYLMDEPFAGVDARTESAILEVLRGLSARGAAVVVVHHDLGTVRDYFDDLVLLKKSVVAAGPVSEVWSAELLERAYGGRLVMFGAEGAA